MWKTNPNMKIPHCYDGDKAFIGKAAVCVTDPLQPWRNLTRPFQKKENLRKVLKIKEIFSSKLKEFENDRDEFFRKLSAHLNENNEERKINEIIEKAMKSLSELKCPYKFIVTCMLVQKTDKALFSCLSVNWENSPAPGTITLDCESCKCSSIDI